MKFYFTITSMARYNSLLPRRLGSEFFKQCNIFKRKRDNTLSFLLQQKKKRQARSHKLHQTSWFLVWEHRWHSCEPSNPDFEDTDRASVITTKDNCLNYVLLICISNGDTHKLMDMMRLISLFLLKCMIIP